MSDLKGFTKSAWRARPTGTWGYFCPCCKVERKAPMHPKPMRAANVAKISLAAIFVTMLTWPWFEWKGIVSFFPLWIVFESVYRSYMRAALACSSCGFDPFLYLADVKLARQEIESHWRKKFAEKGVPYPERLANPAVVASPVDALAKALDEAESPRPDA